MKHKNKLKKSLFVNPIIRRKKHFNIFESTTPFSLSQFVILIFQTQPQIKHLSLLFNALKLRIQQIDICLIYKQCIWLI